jgi:2'-5' RNA ligase
MFALIPTDPVYREIRVMQEYIAEQYRSSEALRRPVHITMIPPFEAPSDIEPGLIDFTQRFAACRDLFEIVIHGFGQFREKVLFVKPLISANLLELHHDLSVAFDTEFQQIHSRASHHEFHPHITIGYRDLSHERFLAAWKEFHTREFDRTFHAEHLSLMRHDGSWVECARGRFGHPNFRQEHFSA